MVGPKASDEDKGVAGIKKRQELLFGHKLGIEMDCNNF